LNYRSSDSCGRGASSFVDWLEGSFNFASDVSASGVNPDVVFIEVSFAGGLSACVSCSRGVWDGAVVVSKLPVSLFVGEEGGELRVTVLSGRDSVADSEAWDVFGSSLTVWSLVESAVGSSLDV